MYEIFVKLMNEKGITPYRVSKDTGISQSVLSAWKLGQTSPKLETMAILAEYFGVPIELLITGKYEPKTSTSGRVYHFSDKTAEMAEKLTKRPDLMDLLTKAENLDSEAVLAVSAMLDAFSPKKGEMVG